MDFTWNGEGAPIDGELNLLGSDNILLDLDEKTLQCLVGGPALPPLPEVDDPKDVTQHQRGTTTTKRRRSEQNFTEWMAETFTADDDTSADGGEATADESNGQATNRQRRVGKRGRPMSDAAVAKANRERARRERLNEYLDELAKLCDPSGKITKNDRVTVVADAIRVVQQLRVENNQLKQLNKFLEERTAALERARAQAMFMMQQPPVTTLPSSSNLPLQKRNNNDSSTDPNDEMLAVAPAQTQAAKEEQQNIELREDSIASGLQHVYVPVPVHSLSGHAMMKQHEVMPTSIHGVPAVSWLPAPDINQDQKLRPPAA